MTDKHYAFVDRKCERCGGWGCVEFGFKCPECYGTGIIGGYEEVPDSDVSKINSIPYIARQLRKVRENRKIGMDELAREFGWSLVHLSNIETGREKPTDDERIQIMLWIEQG